MRLAVLYGSAARGELHSASDVDVLVDLAKSAPALTVARLGLKLEGVLERPVQLVTLAEAERSPLLLADVIRDGRVLVDRDSRWARLRRRARSIEAAAASREVDLDEAAWATLDRFAGDIPRHFDTLRYAVETFGEGFPAEATRLPRTPATRPSSRRRTQSSTASNCSSTTSPSSSVRRWKHTGCASPTTRRTQPPTFEPSATPVRLRMCSAIA